MTEQETQLCREAFERELIDNHTYAPRDLEQLGGAYKDDWVQLAWDCARASWVAACKHAAARDELADMIRAGKGGAR